MLEIALIGLSVAGFGVSAFTTFRVVLCRGGEGGCDVVMATRYARLFGFPNSVLAGVYFAILAAFGVDRLGRGPILPLWPALGVAALSLVMTAYLVFILFFRLRRT